MFFSCLWLKKYYLRLKNNYQLDSYQFGFSLIELLVVVGIVSLLTGAGIASYNSFHKKSLVEKTALELKTNLRQAQANAVNNVKDSGCPSCLTSPLTGWYVDFSNNRYYCQCGGIDCSGYTALVDLDIDGNGSDDFSLPSGGFLFLALGGTDLASSVTITVTDGVNSGLVIVDPGGEVRYQ
jgi:prepilin-type N-terminal cleavage/methylation domain-containing protein